MNAALQDNDFEVADASLRRYLSMVTEPDPDQTLVEAARKYRGAQSGTETESAFTALRETLSDKGFLPSHTYLVAMANRVLRIGTNPQSDAFFHEMISHWEAEERRLGVELDARVIAYRMAQDDQIDDLLAQEGINASIGSAEARVQWRFGVVSSLLWARGAPIRQAGLELRSRFTEMPKPEPLLLRGLVFETVPTIDLLDDNWTAQCLDTLASNGLVHLTCPINEPSRISEAMAFLAVNPVDTGYLSVFARATAVKRANDLLLLEVEVAEAV